MKDILKQLNASAALMKGRVAGASAAAVEGKRGELLELALDSSRLDRDGRATFERLLRGKPSDRDLRLAARQRLRAVHKLALVWATLWTALGNEAKASTCRDTARSLARLFKTRNRHAGVVAAKIAGVGRPALEVVFEDNFVNWAPPTGVRLIQDTGEVQAFTDWPHGERETLTVGWLNPRNAVAVYRPNDGEAVTFRWGGEAELIEKLAGVVRGDRDVYLVHYPAP